jgi:hypothetical protein
MDGSNRQRVIGADVYEWTSKKMMHEPVGNGTISTVEAAELEAINLALGYIANIARTRSDRVRSSTVHILGQLSRYSVHPAPHTKKHWSMHTRKDHSPSRRHSQPQSDSEHHYPVGTGPEGHRRERKCRRSSQNS